MDAILELFSAYLGDIDVEALKEILTKVIEYIVGLIGA